MYYLWLVWQYWIGLFPANEVLGSKFNTGLVAIILAFAVIGCVLRRIFGKDPGVR
jgi:hypothetical protein